MTGIFLACTRPWALSKAPSAKSRCLFFKECTENCSDHCNINNKYSLNVDCWMQSEHETGFEDLIMGCGAYRGIQDHLTLDIRWQGKRFG